MNSSADDRLRLNDPQWRSVTPQSRTAALARGVAFTLIKVQSFGAVARSVFNVLGPLAPSRPEAAAWPIDTAEPFVAREHWAAPAPRQAGRFMHGYDNSVAKSTLAPRRRGSRFGIALPRRIMTTRSTESRSQYLHGQAAEQLRRLCNPRVEAYCLASGGLAAGLARALRARRAGGTAPDPAGRRGRDRLAAPPPEIAGPPLGGLPRTSTRVSLIGPRRSCWERGVDDRRARCDANRPPSFLRRVHVAIFPDRQASARRECAWRG